MRGPEVSVDSITDSVTGLPDGRVFTVFLERKIALARRTLKPISVVYFEIDEFESFAPYVREHAMRATSRVMTNTFRESDTICDLRDGVLVALLDDTSEAGAVWAADRVRKANAESPSRDVVTLSAGIACYPSHAMEAHDLVSAAQSACNQARAHGPSRIEVATEGDDT
ncbi:MAG: GGDEF domain-containing protein [Actinomycetota bacterium]|nr:GGDEF domain-containing protein [Actinomycetota bacterium]MEC9058830.1 GGDEF domain-containing protein [Actinomycetota bacterium]MEC9473318.1 GGDEF domain-containing protein [Actinomycetota bacterium]MEE3255977.1 GGDEF domain-containing protein [Actinomycetota bacterium]